MTEIQDFIATWTDKGSEVADKVTYWNALLRFLGVPQKQIDDKTFIEYEKPIKLNSIEHFHGSIDAYIPSTKVLIEQKSHGVDLFKPEDRPNGGQVEKITPYEQARRYDNNLPADEKARFLVLCNFTQIVVYDVRQSLDTKPYIIELKDLKHDLSRLSFLVDLSQNQHLEKEKRVSLAAGELVGKIYNELLKIYAQYGDIKEDKITKSINALCVRLVFCLYAEDAGLFNDHEQFYDYLKDVKPNKIGVALRELFKVLDTKDRTKDDPFFEDEKPELAAFPYVNGGLFHDTDVIIPPFTPELKHILLDEASRQFDWSDISPTIFGAVFESTLNPDTRRQGGMHYTSVENIHKVIDHLFLNDLKAELQAIKDKYDQAGKLTKWQKKAMAKDTLDFQAKLSKLTFMDPACGSGNFLTETYLSLRKLENETIRLRTMGESILDMGDKDIIQVSIQQFFGIEINDFAVSVAKTALWIAEDQMMKETQDLIAGAEWDFLPLQSYNHIHEGNALTMDWNKILPNYACHYLISNPPFVGARKMTDEQKSETRELFSNISNSGVLDYVSNWYKKAAQYMEETPIRTAFVSTNSITQGEQVKALWKPLLDAGIEIDFAYRSFAWSSEASQQATVTCVIVGFSCKNHAKNKYIFDNGQKEKASYINPYLIDCQPCFIESRRKPISDMPQMYLGCDWKDNDIYLFTKDEMDNFLKQEPGAKKFFRPYIMGREFLNRTQKYCLWLVNATSADLAKLPKVAEKVRQVKQFRKDSSSKDTQRYADMPTRPARLRYYSKERNTIALALPRISTDKREYMPMELIKPDVIAGSSILLIPEASLYVLGVLESSVHMNWLKVVCGRLGTGFRYSNGLVYNNLPWPNPTPKQKSKIEKTAQAILDARDLEPDSSLANLYDKDFMPIALKKAHEANDKAVREAYGIDSNASENEVITKLFNMYEKLAKD